MSIRIMNLTLAKQFICILVIVMGLTNACQRQDAQILKTSTPTLAVSPQKWSIESVRLARIQDRRVFVSTPPHYVAAFDLNTGSFAWQADGLGLVTGAPITSDSEHLYVVTSKGVVALNGANGAVQWQASLPTGGSYHELTAIEEERIVVYGDIDPSTDDQVVYTLDSHTGNVIWQVKLSGSSIDWYRPGANFQEHSAVAYYRGQVYLRIVRHIEGRSGILFGILALDAKSGSELWRFYFGVKQMPGEGPSFGADSLAFGEDAVYIPTYLGPLYVVNNAGALRRMIDEWWTSPVRADDLIVTEVLRKGIVALDQSTGAEIWTTSLEKELDGPPQIVPLRNYLFVEVSKANEARIAILELASGKRMGTITPLNSSECSKPLILNTCGNQLCLVTMNCIYQFSITPSP